MLEDDICCFGMYSNPLDYNKFIDHKFLIIMPPPSLFSSVQIPRLEHVGGIEYIEEWNEV